MNGSWTFGDLLEQVRIMRKLGPLCEVMGMNDLRGDELDVFERLLEAMTTNELRITELHDPKRGPERCQRIAERAGVDVKEVQRFVKAFHGMERVVALLRRPPRRER